MSRLKELLERANKLNEEDFDPENDKNNVDNEDDMSMDTDPDNSDDENPDEPDASDTNAELESVEMAFTDNMVEIGLVGCEAEKTDSMLTVDLSFENNSFTVQMFIEDGSPKMVLLGDESEPVLEQDLPSSFSDDEGNLVIDLANLPLEEIKQAITNMVDVPKEQPMEAYRWKEGVVESFNKTLKLEKKAVMKYKKESAKKKAKNKKK